MNKFFASLLCCSLTLPMLLHAEQSSSSQTTPSQKKFTRKQIVEAGKNAKSTPKQKTKKASKTAASAQPKKTASAAKPAITSNVKKTQQPKKNFYAKTPQAFLAASDDESESAQEAATSQPQDRPCEPGPNSFRFSMAHREGKGIGYPQGYTSIDMFLMFSSIGNVYPFFDIRGHMTNNGKPAANVGFGVRYLPDDVNAVFGINGFFDFKQARHSTYEQLGVGIEILGTQWSFHANGYFPIIKTSNVIGINFDRFAGNSALIHLQSEIAMKGVDANVGRSLVHRGFFDLSAYLGGYYFQGHEELKAPGAYLKLTSSLTRFFSVDVQGSYDTLFKTIFQGAASLNIPLGKRVKTKNPHRTCYQETALARNLTDPVARFEMIVTHLDQQTVLGQDPRTGLPLSIVFVDNTTVGGDGTAETPYASLALAEANSLPGQMIYVYSGDGTSRGMNTGITLQNSQWLQSSLFSFDLLTDAGLAFIPAQTSNYPLISSAGDGITLANGNIVSGFHVAAASNNIIGLGISGAQITNNLLSGASNSDIGLQEVTGNITITGNTSTSSIGLGIISSGAFNADINNNSFNNSGDSNLFVELNGPSASTLVIQNNLLQNSIDGLLIQLNDNSSATAKISGNTLNNMTGNAAALSISTNDNSQMTAYIYTNAFSNAITGILATSADTSTGSYAVISNLVVDSSLVTSAGVTFFTDNSSIMTTALAGNTSNSPVGYFFDNNTGTAFLGAQSINLQLSGIQSVNAGIVETSGTITYIPYNPPNLD